MKIIKTLFRTRIRWLLSLSALITGTLLISYAAFAQGNRGKSEADVKSVDSGSPSVGQSPDSDPDPLPEGDLDPEFQRERREWQEWFFGLTPGSLSPAAYESASAAARALPPSPLLQGRKFISPQAPSTGASWGSPIPPPIRGCFTRDASTRVEALGIDPTNHNVVYTGSFGGLAKSTDAGVTWQYLSDNWASEVISAIAVGFNASTHDYVYAGTGTDPHFGVGLYRSFDGGASWTQRGSTEFAHGVIRAIVLDPRDSLGRTVYVGNGLSNAGLWLSTDSGDNWVRLRPATGHYGVHAIAIDPSTSPSTVYYIDDDGVYKGIKSGPNWTWTLIRSLAACDQNGRCALNRLSVVNSKVYVSGGVGADRKLLKSTDAGATWPQIPTECPCGADTCVVPNPTPCSTPSGNVGLDVFAVDPSNPQIIVAGNAATYQTDNEGASWTEIGRYGGNPGDPTRELHPDQRVIKFAPDNSGYVYVGNDGGVFKSTDHGQTWANANHNFPGAWLYGVALSRDDSMIGGTQDAGQVFSDPVLTAWGTPWKMIWGGDSYRNLIDPIDGTVGYFTVYYAFFARFNRTAPRSWVDTTPCQFPPQFFPPCGTVIDTTCSFFPAFSMNPLSPTHVIAACQHIVRTLNGPTVTRASWTTIGPNFGEWSDNVNATYEAPSDSNIVYAVTGGTVKAGSRVWVTSDANLGTGAHWTNRTAGTPGHGVRGLMVDPTNRDVAYLACEDYVYKTVDRGAHWAQRGIANLFYRDVAVDPRNPQNLFASSNAGVYASTDGGQTWGSMSAGIPSGVIVNQLSFNGTSRQLAAATIGRGAYVLDLDDVPPTVQITSPHNGDTVSGTITIAATASDNHRVDEVIFVLETFQGVRIWSTPVSSPPYQIPWNTTSVANGVYRLTATALDPAGNSTTSVPVVVTVNN
jgi:photosystem II stability/assembly factor-like uncharacterized protein